MKSAEETLFPHHFAKCNHWYIVNLAHVKRITKDTVIVGDSELEMSRRARAGFLDALTAYMGGGMADAHSHENDHREQDPPSDR